MLSFIRKHPVGVGAGAAVVLAGLAWLAFGFFGVQTLFIDDVVEEAGPVFDAEPAALETEPAGIDRRLTAAESARHDGSRPARSPSTGAEADAGADVPADDDTGRHDPARSPRPPRRRTTVPPTPEIVTEYAGRVRVRRTSDRREGRVLGNGTGQRFLRFENFETDNGPDLNVYLVNSSTGDVSDYIDLGDLTGNIGDQNYEIPEGVDLTVYDEVVIWCVRFGVGFGDARLMPV